MTLREVGRVKLVQVQPSGLIIETKETLQFLGHGRRGFLLTLSDGQEAAEVRSGDEVFVVNAE